MKLQSFTLALSAMLLASPVAMAKSKKKKRSKSRLRSSRKIKRLAKKKEAKKLTSLSLALTGSTNTFPASSPEHSSNALMEATLSRTLSDDYRVRIYLSATKDTYGDYKQRINDGFGSFIINHNTGVEGLTLFSDIRLGLPLSKASREDTSLRTRFTYTPTAVYQSNLLPDFTFVYKPFFIQNFHEFQTSKSGDANTNRQIMNLGNITYTPLKKLSLSFTLMHIMSWTYENERNTDSFFTEQELAYQITPLTSAAIGHSNSGGIYGANGADSNVKIFNERSSTYYGKLSVTF